MCDSMTVFNSSSLNIKMTDSIIKHILYMCVLWQNVALLPITENLQQLTLGGKVKSETTKFSAVHSIPDREVYANMPALQSLKSKLFLQQDSSDILKRRKSWLHAAKGKVKNVKAVHMNSLESGKGEFSHRKEPLVYIERKGSSSSPHRAGDFLSKSSNQPVDQQTNISASKLLAKLTYSQLKSTHERKEGPNSEGIAKAAALVSNLQQSPAQRISTMILVISSTFVVALITCVTVSIFQCCCRKKRSTEDLPGENKEEIDDNVAIRRSRSSIHDTPTYRPLSINSTGDGLVEEDVSVSVRDKIKAFETVPVDQRTTTPEHGKPVRKRPKSKAFEEFENQGIIIGMGKVKPMRPKSGLETDMEGSGEPGLLNEIMASMSRDYNNITMLSDTSNSHLQNGSNLTPDTEISSYLDEEDEFSEIQRNTHILRSFKRAPPPKNRSKSKRASRRRIPLQDSTNISHQNENRSEIPDSFLRDEEEKPTDTSVQKVWTDLGSPSIHSSDSRTDINRLTDPLANENHSKSMNGHTPKANNGHSYGKEVKLRRGSDREATPPEIHDPNERKEINGPPKGMTMYENPCYESIDIIQDNIRRSKQGLFSSDIHQLEEHTESQPVRHPRSKDRRVTPPKSSPENSHGRPKSQSRISPDSHSPDKNRESPTNRRISPPKQAKTESQNKGEKRYSWKETSPSGSQPRPLKQTHL